MFYKYEKIIRFSKNKEAEFEGFFSNGGTVYVQEKLDGANCSLYYDSNIGAIVGASRNLPVVFYHLKHKSWNVADGFRGLSNWMRERIDRIEQFFQTHPNVILRGEWLVKHRIEYPEECYRKFYLFDIEERDADGEIKYWGSIHHLNNLSKNLLQFFLEFVPSVTAIDIEQFLKDNGYENKSDYEIFSILHDLVRSFIEKSPYTLLKDKYSKEPIYGYEGFVFKNYDFKNKYGRKVFVKIISKEFNEEKQKEAQRAQSKKESLEHKFVLQFCNSARLQKLKLKLSVEEDNIKRLIPALIESAYKDLIEEELYGFLKKHKHPNIDFRKIRGIIAEEVRGFIL